MLLTFTFSRNPTRLQLALSNQAFWIVIRLECLILPFVNAKLFQNVIHACAFWKCALKPCMGKSAQYIGTKYLAVRRSCFVIRTAVAMLVNAQFKSRTQSRSGFRNVIRSFVNRPSLWQSSPFLFSE